jgi:hypothetical protein
MTDASGFGKFVPGFDFLQSLVSNAGAALPNVGQWIVPTLDPDELEKRINELRTVQFWLEQNSRMLATTIQALEVQRMTLSTLRGMNVSMGDLQAGLAARPSAPSPAPSPAPTPAPPPAATASAADEPGTASAVDPMQWWGSLTQQFSKLAADAMQQAAQAAGPVTAAAQQAATAPAAAAKAPVPRKARPATKGAGRTGGGTQSP